MPDNLIAFLQQLGGAVVQLELKNNSVVTGEVLGVDANMNTHMKNVKITAKGKNPTSVQQLTVRGCTIRFIELGNVDCDKLLRNARATKK